MQGLLKSFVYLFIPKSINKNSIVKQQNRGDREIWRIIAPISGKVETSNPFWIINVCMYLVGAIETFYIFI